jgi:hypothetical protein
VRGGGWWWVWEVNFTWRDSQTSRFHFHLLSILLDFVDFVAFTFNFTSASIFSASVSPESVERDFEVLA